ncbi:poly-gamma-glutamate hydrolase family protein [Streptomyces aureocirculatus]|uniref:poly-gamma-glutamate hydrolase family protein n=1 Tax=Streptomyces aureocirculatus TaxID=67275 RepID=UPI0006905E1E|nr:poly-gamma-glutamate hydrolase family protein [Streptomyces aureocirculatus]
MADKYADWNALVTDRDPDTGELVNVEGRDWYVKLRPGSGVYLLHIAIHGGAIEAPPEQLADHASSGCPFYTFAGTKSSDNASLHITSTRFDEPRAVDLARRATRIVSWHGSAGEAGEAVTYVGGLDSELGSLIRARLTEAGYRCEDPPGDLGGMSPGNICNIGLRSCGVQLEISRAQRRQFFTPDLLRSTIQDPANRTAAFYAYVEAVSRGIADLPCDV